MGSSGDAKQSYVSRVRLLGWGGGAVKALGGFKKSHHTLPDADTPATRRFLGQLCTGELTEEAEALFQTVRAAMNYKRKDLSLDLTSPTAVLTAKDFVFEWDYALEPADPASYVVTRTLHGLRSGDLVQAGEFDAVFAGRFTAVGFDLRKGVQVEAVIDAVEGLDDENAAGLRVDYPSDCRTCTLSVPDVAAEVVCDGASLEMRFTRAGSPRELLEAFAAVRAAFALSKSRPLAGLL
ncbi:MAG: hypothetical protein ABII82_03700 [Verrucomicrobiota bacterium]